MSAPARVERRPILPGGGAATPARPPIGDRRHAPRRALSLTALYVAFLLSGAAGLLYETLWARYLALLLGHSAYAQVIVLMIFLGGTAVGALVAGTFGDRLAHPLLAYALAELFVGVLGAAFHPIYAFATDAAYQRLFPAIGSGAPLLLAQWTLAALLILPQSVVLGATFPLMSSGLMRRDVRRPGRILASLYFANGLGGAAGVLVGGFVLVGLAGLPGSLVVAGALSGAAACIAGGVALTGWRPSPIGIVTAHSGEGAAVSHAEWQRSRSMLLAVAFGTAVASLVYEIAWTRMLSLLLGSATHSFELMLSSFILGIALGAFWLRRRIDRVGDRMTMLARVQLIMGVLAIATLPLYMGAFRGIVELMGALDATVPGYALFNVGRYGICLLIMLPATFCAGITLPLITRILLARGAGESAVGLVYGVNTIGSIIGAAAAAMLLLPAVGLKAMLIIAAAVDMLLGIWVLAASRERDARRPYRPVVVAALVAMVSILAASRVEFDRTVLTSGVFRTRHLPPRGANKLLFYRDGQTATVSATYHAPGIIMLATNGKVDASLDESWLKPLPLGTAPRTMGSDAATQTLLAVLALAHDPGARTAAVIGQGSGMTSHLLLGSPRLDSVTTIEIEPEMILGSNVFYPANRRVFDDRRSHFVIEDARAFLAATGKRYDLIVSEPSNPWVSGASSLFTTEFYRIVSGHLAPRGVFVQWVQLYEISDDLLLPVIAGIHRNFRSWALYNVANTDIAIVASNSDSLPAPDWSIVRLPQIDSDLRGFVPLTEQTLDRLWVADRRVFAPLLDAEGIVANSDYRPVLDLNAERERYLGHAAREIASFGLRRFDPFAALTAHRFAPSTEPVTTIPEIDRARSAALSARLRLALDAAHDTLPPDREYPPAALRMRMLESFLAANSAPPDWQVWMRNVAIVEHDVHGSTAGTADESFYAPIYRFMRANRAPGRAVAALDFMHALAAWDFPTASRAADLLLPDAELGEGWVPADMLREGAVVAKLATGDAAGAGEVFEKLTRDPRVRSTLRSRLLAAHIRAATRR